MRRDSLKRIIELLLGVGLAVALLWFFFRDTNWSDVWRSFEGASLPLLVALSASIQIALHQRAGKGPVPRPALSN